MNSCLDLSGHKEEEEMFVALILLLVVVGSVLFHLTSPWWFSPLASNWGYVDTTIIITFWITGVVYVAIILFVAIFVKQTHVC